MDRKPIGTRSNGLPHPPRGRRRVVVAATAVVAVLVLAACGSSNSNTSSSTTTNTSTGATKASSTTKAAGPVQHLTLEANPAGELKYNKTTLTAKAGPATLTLTNNSPISHNVTLENSAGAKVAATTTFDGGSHTIPLNLKAGTYKFFCSVPGHRMAGMEGTLTVE
jgi:plastocyanin